MKWLVIILLAVFPFGQLLRWTIPGTAVTLLANDFVVGLVVLLGWRSRRRDKLISWMLVWIAAMIVSLAVNIARLPISELATASLYGLRWVGYALLFFVIKPEYQSEAVRWLKIDVLIVAVAGILQFILLPDVSFLAVYNWDNHYYRAVSTFLDPGFTGAILVLGLILFWESKQWFLGVITYLAMALTYSRASFLMYLLAFLVIAISKRSAKIFLVSVLVLALTIPLLPKSSGEGTKLDRENSIQARLNNWRESVIIWSRSPVLGVGFNAYRWAQGASIFSHAGAGADSSLLLVLATTGVLGLGAYLGLLGKMWVAGRKDLVFAASFLGVLVHSWFNNTLFYPWVMEWLWLLLAIRKKA